MQRVFKKALTQVPFKFPPFKILFIELTLERNTLGERYFFLRNIVRYKS